MLDQIPTEIKVLQKSATAVQKRFGEPQDIANVITFLADEQSSWISGQVLNASGGWTMH